ncbi:MAG: amidohydrolase family protein [Gemmatimonadaceae bacterium]|nr:amidohydrolase family protein [Gemmatimonadaceae bacterium]
MRETSRFLATTVVTAVAIAFVASPLAAQERAIAIRGGTVVPMDGPAITNATVVMRGGKITAVGANVTIPAGATVVDARGKYVLPGLIDAMTSLGIGSGDLNEPADPVSPQLRVFEAFNPFGDFGSGTSGPLRLHELLGGGVTTMYIAPADAALIGGQGAVVKTAGDNLAAMSLRDPAAIDITLGEPPRKAASAKQRDPATRMAEVAMIRQALVRAQEYQRNKAQNPSLPRDLGQEALGKLLRREIPARIQANAPVDIRNALQLAEEFGFDLVIDGAANAKSQLAQLAARKVPVILGQVSHPYVSNEEIPDKSDYPAVDETLPATLTNAGVTTAIATFSRAFGSLAPSGSSKWLLLDAGIAAGYGMTEQQVLQAVTIIPARILGVQDRVGSLTVGKDADVIVLDGPPLSMKSWVERVYVGGELVHEKR